MRKITGIRSVDFLITATGEGVVNKNGNASIYNPAAEQWVNNHNFPKLRGVDPMRRAVSSKDGDTSRGLSLADSDLVNAALIVSANCIRHYIFRTVSFGSSTVTRDNVGDALASLLGLMRGYTIVGQNTSLSRKSPLRIVDLECAKPGLRYNQCSRAGERTDTSLFSNFATDKDLHYEGKGTISIEDLQFIPLENSFGRSAFCEIISEEVGRALAAHVTEYLQDLTGDTEPQATFVNNAVRKGGFTRAGEAGLMLNDAAIQALVDETLYLIRTLFINQAQGYVRVTNLTVDYNDGHAFRMLDDISQACPQRELPYAQYFSVEETSTETFQAKMDALKAREDARKEARTEKRQQAAKRKADRKALAAAQAEQAAM